MKNCKKGQLGGASALTALGGLAIAIIAVAVILSSGAEIQEDLRIDQCTYNNGTHCVNSTGGTAGLTYSSAYNVTEKGLENTEKVSNKTSLVTTVAVAVLIISLIVGGFGAVGFFRG